jgi:type I restriction enzyme S subunit
VDIQGFEEGIFRKYTDGEGCRLCKEGDLLIVWDGSRSGLVGKAPAGAIGSTLAKVEIDGVINDYGYYFLKSHYQYLNTNPKGSGTPHVDPDLLWDLDIRVPDHKEQHRIVEKIEELFSELDNGVENLKKAQKQLKTYRQAVLKDAFEGKLTKEWREQQSDQPTPDELLQQIKAERKVHRQRELAEWEQEVEQWEKDGRPGRKPSKPRKQSRPDIVTDKEISSLPEIPEQWRYIKIGNVINALDQGWSPKCKNEPASEGEWGVIKTTAIQDGKFLEFENKKLPDKLDPRKDHEIKKGDILITRAGPRSRVGICCLVKNVREKLINCDKAYRIKTGAFNAKYLMYILNSPIFNRILDEIKSGINDSGVNLTQTAFLKIIIPVPGIDEQQEIVNEIESRLSMVDQLEQTIKENLQKAEALRQSILKKAFGGELVGE